MSVLSEVPLTAEVKIEDLGGSCRDGRTLHQIRKWLIGKGNALPPASEGVICDIGVGNARPVAQRVRKISSQFCEKLADRIRGLFSAHIEVTLSFPHRRHQTLCRLQVGQRFDPVDDVPDATDHGPLGRLG
ncbi:Eukaryotic/viral aspartic protease [Phytophthora megakarya]|uniref:Eukaryotic/viral aspartic protease n=1 Tax=Phytophthora megakarya TaxID=4795 RepID=A0A225UEI8_9STRA|nr:Eukaryotic/viral aspartic protease [Phytophthora megakarya]